MEFLLKNVQKGTGNHVKNAVYEVPKVSVFMPAYNCEDFIEEAIISVLNQSFSDFELLITDDGGTDSTHEIVKKYEQLDNRIKFYPKENGGIYPHVIIC